MNKEDLLKMIGEDEFGLLKIKPKNTALSADDRLVSSFEEINSFYQKEEREPKTGSDIGEHRLAARLEAFQEDPKKCKVLKEYDRYGFLPSQKNEIYSMEDIFQYDNLGLLNDGEAKNLFDLKHIPSQEKREKTDHVAKRKPCKDFEKYEKLFQNCQKDLREGKRRLIKFNENKIKEEAFFVLNGILVYIDQLFEVKRGKHSKVDGRIRCIFENGTESGMLFRSLGKGLYENGKAVSGLEERDIQDFDKHFSGITQEDAKTGFLYTLQSLSVDPKIQNIKNLYKIGYSTTSVEERIQNAKDDPTYLMAPVKILSTFECYNFNPQKMEQLLHNFFGEACLNIDIYDKDRKRFCPREWFVAPHKIIEKTVQMIVTGEIIHYKYDPQKKEIIQRR